VDRAAQRRDNSLLKYTVTVSHDETECVWFVQESDVPGLNAEAPTLDTLVEIISDVAPDLISENLPSAEKDAGGWFDLCVQHVVDARRADAA